LEDDLSILRRTGWAPQGTATGEFFQMSTTVLIGVVKCGRHIIKLLSEHGARPTDVDANGKTVGAAAASDWIRDLLNA
jgi:hypothetical protein